MPDPFLIWLVWVAGVLTISVWSLMLVEREKRRIQRRLALAQEERMRQRVLRKLRLRQKEREDA